MSVVTDILLCTAIEDGALVKDQHPNADMVSAWLVHRHGPGCELKKLDDYTGGKWAMQCDVFGVAVNYCDTDGLVAAFRAVRWEHPESAQLLVKEEDWDSFRVFTAGGADARTPRCSES